MQWKVERSLVVHLSSTTRSSRLIVHFPRRKFPSYNKGFSVMALDLPDISSIKGTPGLGVASAAGMEFAQTPWPEIAESLTLVDPLSFFSGKFTSQPECSAHSQGRLVPLVHIAIYPDIAIMCDRSNAKASAPMLAPS